LELFSGFFSRETVDCYDVEPNKEVITKLTVSKNQTVYNSEEELILRFYPDTNIVLSRKSS